MNDIVKQIELKFTSGNEIPVKQAVVKVEEWNTLREYIADLHKEIMRLEWRLQEQD